MTRHLAGGPPRAARLLVGRVGGVAGGQAASQVVVGVLYLVAARSLAPTTLGLIVTCVAANTIASTVFDLGLGRLLVRDVAGGRTTLGQARAVIRVKRRFGWLLVLPTAGIGITVTRDLLAGAELGLVALVMWEAQTAGSLMRAQERFAQAAAAQIVARALGLGVLGVLLLAGVTFYALPSALLVAFGAEAVVDRAFLGADRTPRPAVARVLALHREAVPLGLADLAAIAQQLDTPFVAAAGGPLTAGLYAAAGRLLNPLGFLASSLGLVGLPWLARVRNEAAALRREEWRVIRLAGAISVAPLLAAAVGPFLLPVLLGPAYRESGIVFAVLAIGSVFSSLNQPLSIIAINCERQSSVARAVAIGVGLGLVATYVLTLAGGAVWAAAGFTVGQLWILAHLTATVRSLRRSGP